MIHVEDYMQGTDPVIDQIVANIRQVYDPEIFINIYDLGLIYDIDLNEDMDLKVTMTLTSPFCPVGDQLYMQVHEACEVPSIKNIDIDMTFEPPWDMNMIPDHAKLEMGLL